VTPVTGERITAERLAGERERERGAGRTGKGAKI